MRNPTDDMITRLEATWPAWQVWVVHRLIGGPVWCARRWDDDGRPPATLINVSSADDLAEAIAEMEADGAV